jgi:DNA repair protein RecN (Recombination protein N)
MLQKLLIQNYILIKELEIFPDAGMNIITGETGAGKSILLGAIGLLMGQRADTKTLYDESEKCIIEGHFLLQKDELKEVFEENDLDYENPCIVRREIVPSGKSRAFVNDTPVNLEKLDAIVGELMDVHSQHETIFLKKQYYQIQLLDHFAQNSVLKTQFQQAFSLYRKSEKRYEELLATAKEASKELDYLRFVFGELDEAHLEKEEQEKLEAEQALLENADDIKEKLAQAQALLEGEEFSVISAIHSLSNLFDQLASYSPNFLSHKDKLSSIRFDLRDLNNEITHLADHTETNPERLLEVQDRLSLLYKLQRKHGVASVEELETIRDDFGTKLSLVENSDALVEEAREALQAAEKQMLELGKLLTKSRVEAVSSFELAATQKLTLLGMPNATFQIQLQPQTPSSEGLEKVTFLFSANKGLSPKPLADVASGGEFSRLMLVIKYLLAGKKAMPTLIFDEIDAGVSGEIAYNMATLIEEMASRHQIFTITHLPQMASKGKSHFYVYKDETQQRTLSHIRKLNEEERITEIAKMIGGKSPSESARQSAKELLD